MDCIGGASFCDLPCHSHSSAHPSGLSTSLGILAQVVSSDRFILTVSLRDHRDACPTIAIEFVIVLSANGHAPRSPYAPPQRAVDQNLNVEFGSARASNLCTTVRVRGKYLLNYNFLNQN